MHRALNNQNILLRWFYADKTEHCLVGHLHLARSNYDTHTVDEQTSRQSHVQFEASVIWASRVDFAIGDFLHEEFSFKRLITFDS